MVQTSTAFDNGLSAYATNQASPYTVLQALTGHEYPVGLLDVEKFFHLGRRSQLLVSALQRMEFLRSSHARSSVLSRGYNSAASGMGSFEFLNFLTDYPNKKIQVVLVLQSIRNWNKWKQWRERRRTQQENRTALAGEGDSSSSNEFEVLDEEEVGDVPDGQLCVICLMRRRRSAFVPCGHLVCCQRCAFPLNEM
ncbi:E3 ubiquitin-protein ligase SPL2 [Bienertia sinuspersici]